MSVQTKKINGRLVHIDAFLTKEQQKNIEKTTQKNIVITKQSNENELGSSLDALTESLENY